MDRRYGDCLCIMSDQSLFELSKIYSPVTLILMAFNLQKAVDLNNFATVTSDRERRFLTHLVVCKSKVMGPSTAQLGPSLSMHENKIFDGVAKTSFG